MQRVRIKYKKNKELKFIGHLDMVRLWERAFRRTDIPTAYSEGFNPRQKLSFGPPLSLGISSECEFLDAYLEGWASPDSVKTELDKVLPAGIEILEVKNVFSGLSALTAVIKHAQYSAEIADDVKGRIDEILSSGDILIKRKEKEINIRPMIEDISLDNKSLKITVQCDEKGTLKASEITRLFEGFNLKDLKRISLF